MRHIFSTLLPRFAANVDQTDSSQRTADVQVIPVEEGDCCELIHFPRPARIVEEPVPKFLDEYPILTSVTDRNIPAQYVARVPQCMAFSRSNIILQGDKALYDLAARCRGDEIDYYDSIEQTEERIVRRTFKGRMIVNLPPENGNQIQDGICMFGVASGNYGHWMLELLPKMLNFKDAPIPDNVPIYVDGGMPKTHLESLQKLNFSNREILEIPKGLSHFRNLYVSSPIAYSPIDMLPGHPMHDTIWPKDVFLDLRDSFFSGAAPSRGRKLFLSRKSFTKRTLLNEAEISDALASKGFETIRPEEFTFDEQLEIFRSADVIVGSCSSSMTNCIFCKPGCRVIGLIHDNPSFNFRAYMSIVECSGADILFVRGKAVKSDDKHHYHWDYSVEPDRVIRALSL